jgi:BASS family bile acid:Na+ symporter
MADILIKVVMVSVMFLMLGAGLNITFTEVLNAVKKYKLLLFGIMANFVVSPILGYIGMTYFPLDPYVKVGIMLMIAAPIAPMVPPFVKMAKGNVPYSVGLMVIIAILSVFLTPLILTISFPESIGGVLLDPIQIVKTLVMVQLIPISIGMLISQYRKEWVKRLLKFVPRIGQIGLFLGVGLILAQQVSQIISLGIMPHIILVLSVVALLIIGDLMLVGETREMRRSLAVSTAIRNVPLAFLIAGENFPNTVVAPVVLIFSVYTMVLSVVYGKIMTSNKG